MYNNVIKNILLVSIIIFVSGCAIHAIGADEDFVPFDIGKAGASASIKFHVGWMYRDQPRRILLSIRPPGPEWYGSDGSDLRPKFEQLIETITGRKYSDTWAWGNNIKTTPHKNLMVYISWQNQITGSVIKEKMVSLGKPGGHNSDGFNNFILDDGVMLPIGDYIVNVTALENDQRFDGTFRTGIVLGSIGWFHK